MTKLLIVDDDIRFHDGLRRAFRSAPANWDPHFAADGPTALDMLNHQSYDAFITDMDMPKMNGSALLGIVAGKFPNMMCIVISGRYDSLTTYSMTTCSHLFVPKPFNIHDFLEMIEVALIEHRHELKRARIWEEDDKERQEKVLSRLKRLGVDL